jgi:hypothetical protein
MLGVLLVPLKGLCVPGFGQEESARETLEPEESRAAFVLWGGTHPGKDLTG